MSNSEQKPESGLSDVLIFYSGRPIGKPRMTRSDKWKDPPRPAVAKWWDFKDGLMAAALEQGFRPGRMEIRGLGLMAFIKMPKSWSKEKKEEMLGKSHLSKPDLSNIFKAVEDALTDKDETIAWYMDSGKIWAEREGLSLFLKVKDNGPG